MQNTHASTAPWPEGVTHRYLTVAGSSLGRDDLTVDIFGGGEDTGYRCTGCPYDSGPYWREDIAHQHAQGHAATCRGLRRPTQ